MSLITWQQIGNRMYNFISKPVSSAPLRTSNRNNRALVGAHVIFLAAVIKFQLQKLLFLLFELLENALNCNKYLATVMIIYCIFEEFKILTFSHFRPAVSIHLAI